MAAAEPNAEPTPELATAQSPAKLTVAQILTRSAAAYVAQYPRQAVPQVQSTLAKLSLCRTAALGERYLACVQCDYECMVYNSCGDRHCPQCSGAKRSNWLDASHKLILAGVDHYQVVFTLPSQLSRLALGNRRQLYKLLFRAAWLALKETIEAEQGFDPAGLMVLHTWNQQLEAHAHVHAVVPGGGPSLVGGQWKQAIAPDGRSSGGYLVDAITLRRAFRKHYLEGLRHLFDRDELKLKGEFAYLQQAEAQEQLLDELESVEWVSYIEPPPRADCPPETVLKYLARYLTGGPISESRIVSADDHHVTFMAREGKVVGGERKQVPITLTPVEFTRRRALHILPKGYTKTRRFGGWCNRRSQEYVQRCAQLLDNIDAPLAPEALEFDPALYEAESDLQAEPNHPPCPDCGSAMRETSGEAKRSWHEIMNSRHRPTWYTGVRRQI